MKYKLPKPSVAALVIQCSLMIVFTACLYFFLSAFQTKKSYEAAILQLNQKQQSLMKATEQLDSYFNFVATDTYFQRVSDEPQWEKINEVWEDLSYNALLQRLSDLYRSDRPFVLDFFSANIKAEVSDQFSTVSGQAMASAGSSGDQQTNKLAFSLQGYFLCPCR